MSERIPKRLRPRTGKRHVVGSERDVHVLSELAWAGMLTTGQIERLGFPSRRRAQRRLRGYLDRGLVRAHLQAEAMHRDNLWTLTRAGFEFLASCGARVDGLEPFRPNLRSQKLGHALAVRDVAVAFLAEKARGSLALRDLRLDSDLAEEPVMRSVGMVPDGLAAIEIEGKTRTILWEVVSRDQPLAQVRAKMAAYDRAQQSGPAFFRGGTVVVLFVVESENRLENAKRVAAELRVGEWLRCTLLKEIVETGRITAAVARPAAAFRAVE